MNEPFMMNGVFRIGLFIAAGFFFVACNESRRGNDSNVNETKSEAAAEENADKFSGENKRDAQFVYDAVASNYSEIKMAELAAQRSRDSEVQRIAQMLVTAHTASLTELKNVAQANAIAVPVEEDTENMRKLQSLSEESDEDFDEEWCDEMLSVHEESIGNFEDRLDKTEDPELKAFIEKTLPQLRDHQEQLESCSERLKEEEK